MQFSIVKCRPFSSQSTAKQKQKCPPTRGAKKFADRFGGHLVMMPASRRATRLADCVDPSQVEAEHRGQQGGEKAARAQTCLMSTRH